MDQQRQITALANEIFESRPSVKVAAFKSYQGYTVVTRGDRFEQSLHNDLPIGPPPLLRRQAIRPPLGRPLGRPSGPLSFPTQSVPMSLFIELMNRSLHEYTSPPRPYPNIDELKVETLDNPDTDTKCPVCWTTFAAQCQVIRLKCNHMFCPDCIKTWFREHDTCPCCRDTPSQPSETTGPTVDEID